MDQRPSTHGRRLRGVALVGTAALCTMLIPSANAASQATRNDNFTVARANWAPGGYTVAWRSTGGPVTVYANTSPNATTPGTIVGRGAANSSIKVSGATLPGNQRWYFHVTNGKKSVSVAPQSLMLTNDPNLRDIGGIRTTDGRWIKEGLLFRGGAMNKLTDAEVAKLAALGITKSIDLRTSGEASQAPDRLPQGTQLVSDSIVSEDDPAVTFEVGKLDTAGVLTVMGYARGMYMYLYSEMGGGPRETYGFRQFFRELIASNGAPVLYHCTAGDDRTGWASYTLMRILGVSPAAAMKNYLLSNSFNVAMLKGYTDYFKSIGFTQQQADFFLKADYIRSAERSAISTFGSWNNYVKQGLGLSAADIAKLKQLYLAS